MTASDPEAVRPIRWPSRIIAACGLSVGVLIVGLLVTELGSYVSPLIIFCVCLAVMTIADAFGLALVSRRANRREAVLCGSIGVGALVIQAGGVYLSALLFLDRLTFPGSGWLVWTLPVVALALSAVLLARRLTRRYGWALMIGSAQGFAVFIGFFVTAVAACNCLD